MSWLAPSVSAGHGSLPKMLKVTGDCAQKLLVRLIRIGRPLEAHTAKYPSASMSCTAAIIQHVLHRCDNPACCNPKHLFLGSNLDNVADKVLKHRQARGKTQAKAVGRLSEVQVIGIFNAIGLQREIAKQFGVTQMLVSKIKRGVVWKHLCLNAK